MGSRSTRPGRPAVRGRGPLGPRRATYGERNLVERFFNGRKRFRGAASYYHKLGIVYLHMIYFACIHIMTR